MATISGKEWNDIYQMLCQHCGESGNMIQNGNLFRPVCASGVDAYDIASAAMLWMADNETMPTADDLLALVKVETPKKPEAPAAPDPADKAAMVRHRALIMERDRNENERLSRRNPRAMSGQPAMLEMLKAKVRCAYYFKPDDRRRFLMEAQLQAADNGIEWEDLLPTDLPDSAKKLGLDSLVSVSHAI